MRTVVLKAYTGQNAQEHPDDTFNSSAFVSFLPIDDYINEDQLDNNYLSISLGETKTSYERWLKVIWSNDDNTRISNLRIYFSGELPPGVHLRVGTSANYSTPSNEERSYTAMKTYNAGGDKDIIEGLESSYLFVPVRQRGDGVVESDYIVLQLVVESDKIPIYDFLGSLELKIDYDETN